MKFSNNSKITIICFFIFLSLLIIPLPTAEALEEITLEGRYVTVEKRFEDKGYVFEHYLFVDGEDGVIQYKLDSQNIPNNFLKISGNNVTITGTFTPKDSTDLRMQVNEEIHVSEFTLSNQETFQRSLQREQDPIMTSATLLSGWNTEDDGIHDVNYFTDRHYASPTDSLTAYWDEHSYGKFAWGGTAYDWTKVTTASDPSISSAQGLLAAQDAIDDFDPVVDFTNVDQIILVWDFCPTPEPFAYAYLDPLPFTTLEGAKNLLVVHTFECPVVLNPLLPNYNPTGFPTGIDFELGIGVTAHEIGHTFDLRHTQQIPLVTGAPYNDEHSLMSGGGADGPPGFITYHKMAVGWIDPEDIATVPQGVQQTITLDFANADSGGPNYLMAMVPFGEDGHNYTAEARTDGLLDAIIGNSKGVWIYHHSPTGHSPVPSPQEDGAPLLLVLTETPSGDPYTDFNNAGLDPGDSFTENGVTFEYISDTPTSITIKITNNVTECSPTGPGDWTPPASCEMVGNATVTGNLILQNGRVLTIPNGVVLTVEGYILVEVLSGIYIVSGGGLLWSPP